MITNKKHSRVSLFMFLITTIVLATGCNKNDDINNGNKKNMSINPTAEQEEVEEKADEYDTGVSSGYYLSLGALDKNVALNGQERNESEVSIVSDKMIFPQGAIRSVCIGSWSRKEKSYNPEQSEVDNLIKEIERAKIVKKLPGSVFGKMSKIQTKLLVLNSHGEFRTVHATTYGKGYHEISVVKDDPDDFSKTVYIKSDKGEKKKHIFLYSNEIEKIIKKWILFEKEQSFDQISRAALSVDGENSSVQLSKEELDVLKKCLKDRKVASQNTPCGHDCYFVCELQDGNEFHFSVCSDGESLSTDQQVYIIDGSDSKKLFSLLKSIKNKKSIVK